MMVDDFSQSPPPFGGTGPSLLSAASDVTVTSALPTAPQPPSVHTGDDHGRADAAPAAEQASSATASAAAQRAAISFTFRASGPSKRKPQLFAEAEAEDEDDIIADAAEATALAPAPAPAATVATSVAEGVWCEADGYCG